MTRQPSGRLPQSTFGRTEDCLMSAANTAGNQRGRPLTKGRSGNPAGKPKGARDRATLAAEALLDGEAEALTRKAIELALEGDILALKICLDRILPPRRERAVALNLPTLRTPGDAGEVSAAILGAVTTGQLTLGEASELAKLVAVHVAALESSERYEDMAPIFPGSNSLLRLRGRSQDDE
jgi:hypothetical protein